MTKTLTKADLLHFTGSETWYRHGLARDILYTDGAQKALPKVAAEPFQLWTLRVHAGQSATLTCENGDCILVFEKAIEFTDFPLNEIAFYFVDKTILPPSEY